VAFQGDSKFYVTPANDMAVVGCYCGEVCNCGVIELKQSADPDDEFHMWMNLSWSPRNWRWKFRWRLIWDILCGRTLDTGVSWNRPTCVSLGEWLTREPDWEPKPTREELKVNFQAIESWYNAGCPDVSQFVPPVEGPVSGLIGGPARSAVDLTDDEIERLR
jgi:hypothetical protein